MDKLDDEYASVRFWAVRGLIYAKLSDADRAKSLKRFVPMLKDESVAVRIMAAQGLCTNDVHSRALAVLADTLANSHNSGRHWAAVAIEAIGDNAKPIWQNVKAAENDKYSYTQRVVKNIIENREKRSF